MKTRDARSRLTHAAAVAMLLVLVIWGVILIRMEEARDPNFVACFTPFVGFVTTIGTGFFKWIEGGSGPATPADGK